MYPINISLQTRKIPEKYTLQTEAAAWHSTHQQDDILLEVLEIALLALLVPNFSQLELVTYIVTDSLVLDLELEKN